jgi:predicted HicB family RNase H-like nuclease
MPPKPTPQDYVSQNFALRRVPERVVSHRKEPRRVPESYIADKFLLRLPDGMRAEIERAAKANNRSMNAQIIYWLRRQLE